jgi:penicillin-binding protein 1C
VSARTALASSLNVPAVRTLVMVTPDAFFEQLKKLGLPLRESGGYTASAWRWAAARSRCSI